MGVAPPERLQKSFAAPGDSLKETAAENTTREIRPAGAADSAERKGHYNRKKALDAGAAGKNPDTAKPHWQHRRRTHQKWPVSPDPDTPQSALPPGFWAAVSFRYRFHIVRHRSARKGETRLPGFALAVKRHDSGAAFRQNSPGYRFSDALLFPPEKRGLLSLQESNPDG